MRFNAEHLAAIELAGQLRLTKASTSILAQLVAFNARTQKVAHVSQPLDSRCEAVFVFMHQVTVKYYVRSQRSS